MTEPNSGTDAIRVGIECLTLWMEPGADARSAAAGHIAELVHGTEGPRPGPVVAGLLNLSTLLLLELMKQRGEHDVRGAAGEYLRRLSPRLPE
jgi:hypothetical protein